MAESIHPGVRVRIMSGQARTRSSGFVERVSSSPTKSRRRGAPKMEPYHDIVSCVFEHNVDKMERILRNAAKEGDVNKMAVLLGKRVDFLFNIDAKDTRP